MKTKYITIQSIIMIAILLLAVSCSNDSCEYIITPSTTTPDTDCPNLDLNYGDPCDSNGDGTLDGVVNDSCECEPNITVPSTCNETKALNLSTGVDINGEPIVADFGMVDPFWRVINKPPTYNRTPLNSCTDPADGTFTGEAFAVNVNGSGDVEWVNQPGATTIAPFDLGTDATFLCQTAAPYVFERSFCVLSDTNVDFNFTYKGMSKVTFQLINNITNTVLSTSTTYVWSDPAVTWSASSLSLPTGSYSIRAQLVNEVDKYLGFSFSGTILTTEGDTSLSNNVEGCCDNNVISILNILETDCDMLFNSESDQIGDGWTFNLLDNSNTIISTATTDINGNIFFAGLPDGTYTVEIVNQEGWTQTIASQTVTVINNQVQILEFYNCNN